MLHLNDCVADDIFKYLEKYNLTIISLEDNENLNDKTIADVKELINTNKIKIYIYKQGEEPNDIIKDILATNSNVSLIHLNAINNITEEERNNKEDYITLTKKNLELLKQELYK